VIKNSRRRSVSLRRIAAEAGAAPAALPDHSFSRVSEYQFRGRRRTEVHGASVHNRSQFQLICLRLDTLSDLQNFYNRLFMTSDMSPFAIGISIARALAGKF
jgi:hypothetical protein